jgi:hypothetical protein
VYKAELVRMMLAAELLRMERDVNRAAVRVDNQAAIIATRLTRPALGHHLVDTLNEQMESVYEKHIDTEIVVRWVPGHADIKGNECADDEAKKAARGDSSWWPELPLQLQKPLPFSVAALKRTYNDRVKDQAATQLHASPHYMQMQKIDPTIPSSRFWKLVEQLTRQQASLLVQLCTGHIPLNRQLFRIQKNSNTALSACHHKEETVVWLPIALTGRICHDAQYRDA